MTRSADSAGGSPPTSWPIWWPWTASSPPSRPSSKELVKTTPTSLPQLYGVGPVITGIILGEVGDVARFKNRHHFASYNGTATDDKGSAGHPAYCVNIKGNRKLNHAIHMVAITQIRNSRSPGRAHYVNRPGIRGGSNR